MPIERPFLNNTADELLQLAKSARLHQLREIRAELSFRGSPKARAAVAQVEKLIVKSSGMREAAAPRYGAADSREVKQMARLNPDDDITRYTESRIGQLRQKLLDLTASNALLNYKFRDSARGQVRIIDELPDQLYARMQNQEKMWFRPIAEPAGTPKDEHSEEFAAAVDAARLSDELYIDAVKALGDEDPENPKFQQIERDLKDRVRDALGMPPRPSRKTMSRADIARDQGLEPSYELPQPKSGDETEHRHADNDIQTLLFPDEMERRLSFIREQTRRGIEETGLSTLYIAYGFLEWIDSESSGRTFLAPLLLQPLEIQRVTKAHAYRYSITGTGEEAEANLTLIEKMRQFNIAFPALEEEDTPESYFEKAKEAILPRKGWRVRRFAAVGMFAFGRLVLWHDLNLEKWPADRSPKTHPVVSDLLAGAAGGSHTTADDYALDTQEFDKRIPILITDADASQLSAIVDGMEGRSLAIKGPPGTGKSQTITNLIAALLHANKSVLFVAEKMAALSVVKKRLDHAELGDFVLELHSTKARKLDLLASLKERLELKNNLPFPGKLDAASQAFKQFRKQLTNYVDTLNSKVGRSGKTLQEALWADARHRETTHPPQLDDVTLDRANECSEPDLQNCRRVLSAFENATRDLPPPKGEGIRAWSGVRRILPVFEQDALKRAVATWATGMRSLGDALSVLPKALGIDDRESLSAVRTLLPRVADALEQLHQSKPSDLRSEVLLELATPERFVAAKETHRLWTGISEAEQQVASTAGEAHRSSAESVQELHRTALLLGAGELTSTGLPGLREKIEKKRDDWQRLDEFVGLALDGLDATDAKLSHVLIFIDRALRHVATAPKEVAAARLPSLGTPEGQRLLAEAKEAKRELDVAGQVMSKTIVVDYDMASDDVRDASDVVESGSLLEYWFSRRGRDARKLHRRLRKRRGGPRALRAAALRDLSNHLAQAESFASGLDYRKAFGEHFRGVRTNFDYLENVRIYLTDGRSLASTSNLGTQFYELIAHAAPERVERFRNLAGKHEASWLAQAAGAIDSRKTPTPSDVVSGLTQQIERCDILTEGLRALALRPHVQLNSLADVAVKLSALREMNGKLAALGELPQRIESALGKADSKTQQLLAHIAFVEQANAAVALASRADVFQLIHEGTIPGATLELVASARRVLAAGDAFYSGSQSVVDGADLDEAEAFGSSLIDAPLSTLASWIERSLADMDALSTQAAWLRARYDVDAEGLLGIVTAFGREPLNDLESAFDRVYWRSLVKRAFGDNPELAKFSGMRIADTRKQFRELDKRIQELNRQEIKAGLCRRAITPGNGVGPVGSHTDKALIVRQANQKRPSVTIRKLIERGHRAMQELKPCWMMSPSSIAQFLPQGLVEFDVVIIDEASQMRPEEAIGAAARCKQIIVVGDPMQLPPTSFFDSGVAVDGTDDDDSDGVDNQAESVLDLALSSYQPARNLLWHYRSRHESLIAFSNEQFYEGKLIVFPSPRERNDELGLRWRPVEGVYKGRGVNFPEADAVIEAALEHMRTQNDKSLGIVAVNATQAQHIFDSLNHRIPQDDAAQAYYDKWKENIESFFVKNLESVQGDERDVIMISTVYGKNENGDMFQRFGPINREYGHRRLNVLFTRAKQRVDLFTSMTASDILVTETSRRGVKALRDYLEYAATGRLHTGDAHGGEPESDFEMFVADALRDHGYQVRCQVGVAGFRIDLGVMHPEWPHGFLLGVECDGATYHSSKSARDRDALRQEILEGLKWRLYRIWSTDWFNNPRVETQRLLQHLEQIRRQGL